MGCSNSGVGDLRPGGARGILKRLADLEQRMSEYDDHRATTPPWVDDGISAAQKDEAANAFLAALAILRRLEAIGAQVPCFELFSDASGRLNLGVNPQTKVMDLASKLLKRSRRWVHSGNEILLDFCGPPTDPGEED